MRLGVGLLGSHAPLGVYTHIPTSLSPSFFFFEIVDGGLRWFLSFTVDYGGFGGLRWFWRPVRSRGPTSLLMGPKVGFGVMG